MPNKRQEFYRLYKEVYGESPESWQFDALSKRDVDIWIKSMKESIANELQKFMDYGAADWATAKRWRAQAQAVT